MNPARDLDRAHDNPARSLDKRVRSASRPPAAGGRVFASVSRPGWPSHLLGLARNLDVDAGRPRGGWSPPDESLFRPRSAR